MRHTSYYYYTTVAVVMLACACGRHEDGAAVGGQTDDPRAAAVVENKEPMPEPAALTLNGTIVADPSRTARIVAPMDGCVEGLRVMVGDDVGRGQQVARLVGRDAAALAIKRQQAASKLTIAEQELRLRQSLFDDGMASERELNKAREKKALAEATLAQLAEVTSANVCSPRGGIVLRRGATDGEYVQAGDLLLEVADLGVVWVMADVYEGDIGRVGEGIPVEVTTLARPDERYRGTIDKVYPVLDPDSKTMKVRIPLKNRDTHLLPGIFATITLQP